MNNFYIYTDSEGKLPQLRKNIWVSQSHRFFVKYVNNEPVLCKPYSKQEKVWDYSKNIYVDIKEIKQIH